MSVPDQDGMKARLAPLVERHIPGAMGDLDRLARAVRYRLLLIQDGITPERTRKSARFFTDTRAIDLAGEHLDGLLAALESLHWLHMEELEDMLNEPGMCRHLTQAHPPAGGTAAALLKLGAGLRRTADELRRQSPTTNRLAHVETQLALELWDVLRARFIEGAITRAAASRFIAAVVLAEGLSRWGAVALAASIKTRLIKEDNKRPAARD